MTNLLALHLEEIHRCLDTIKPEIESSGSEEQQLLVNAMIETVDRAIPRCAAMPRRSAQVSLWRHDAVRPVSLCISSTDLLLTDEERPLSPTLRAEVEHIHDTALKMNALIQQIATQFQPSNSP